MAGKIQGADVKTEAELISAGAGASSLIKDTQIYVTASSINKTLDDAIIDGDIGGGGSSFPTGVLAISGATTLVSGDDKKLLKITASSAYTITLPAHSANQVFWLKEVSGADVVTNSITIARNGGTGKIENVSASYVVRQNNFSFGLFDDGTDWWIL